jgi:sugar phosphate permease
MYAPGIVGLVFAAVVLLFMKDTPENFGHAPVSTPKPKQKEGAADEKKPSMIQALKTEVLTSPYVWLFAISYFFVYVIRQGATSWLIFYLKHKGIQDVATRVSGLELGGLAGSLSAGWLSDHLTKKNQSEGNKAGNVGLRVKVAITYTLLTAVFLFGFYVSPNVSWLQWLLVAGIGFSLYGPQMLIGLCGAEAVAKNAVSSCQGFLGIISYAGAASAGVPLALLVEKFGWNAFFASLGASCILVVLLILPMINLKSYSQKVEENNKTA